MTILYILGIRIFHILVIITSLFNSKARLWLKGRKGMYTELENCINPKDKIAWFHCASLGEFEQGRPVIEAFKEKHIDYKILVTFYSPSGYEIRKNYELADFVFYLPLDTSRNAKQFLTLVNPKIVFFIKYEFWYFFLKEIGKRKIPLYMVSGIFRNNQRFFKKRAVKSRKMLGWFTHFFVQNDESKELLQTVGLNNITVTGDTRFDRVYTILEQSIKLPLVEQFVKNNLTLVAGSSWKVDEDIILKYLKETDNSFKIIFAPHEIHKENINRIVNSVTGNKKVIKYSEANENNISDADVLIIDSIGILSSVYRYGNIAYIGGGFGKGIHNILEAATFGMPIIFGSNYLKFQEAVDLIELKGAFPISEFSDLENTLDRFFDDPEQIRNAGAVSLKYVEQRRGATADILKVVNI